MGTLTIFLKFIAYPGHKFLEKWLPSFLRDTGLKLIRSCTNGVANKFQGVLGRFEGKKKFSKVASFFFFFCISGVTDFLKNDQLLFWEIPAWNLSWTAQMVLRTNFKAFKVVSREKKFFFENLLFWLFLHIRGHRFLEKWPTSFLRDTGLCCERILRRFRLFRAKKNFFERKKIFSKIANFLTFLHIQGQRFLEKWPTSFLRDTGLKFCRGLHKWCCEQILRHLRLFRAKNFFQKFEIFWLFLHIRGHRFLEKWPTSFLRDTDRKFVVDCTNGVANEF